MIYLLQEFGKLERITRISAWAKVEADDGPVWLEDLIRKLSSPRWQDIQLYGKARLADPLIASMVRRAKKASRRKFSSEAVVDAVRRSRARAF